MEKCYRKGGRENRDIVEQVKRKIQLPFRDVGCHWSSSTGNMIGKKAIETPEIRFFFILGPSSRYSKTS